MKNIKSSVSIKLPIHSYLYFFCQTVKVLTGIISVSIVAIVGRDLSPGPSWATLPYGFQFLFIMIASYPLSFLMKKYSRKFGFYVSIFFLFLSGGIGFFAVQLKNFVFLLISHSFLGIYTAGSNYFRYAASDNLAQDQKSKSVNLVIAGGLISSLLAPRTITFLKDLPGFSNFSLCYGFFILLALINSILIFFTPDSKLIDTHTESDKDTALEEKRQNSQSEFLKVTNNMTETSKISTSVYILLGIAIISAGFGYGAMGNTMVQSSLHASLTNIAFHKNAFAIQLHTLAMFIPSFFSGYLINKYGNMTIIYVGYLLLILTALINTFVSGYLALVIALILLGIGWNFTYGGGSVLLATISSKSKKLISWQGIGETIIALFSTIGAFSPSILYTSLGWKKSNGLILITSCTLFLITLIGFHFAKKEMTKYTP